MRKLYEMPVSQWVEHPLAMTFPAAVFGQLARLILHYWQTGCRPLPTSDHELWAISRGHKPSWRRYKAQILQVFDDVKPGLDAYWSARTNKRTTLRIASRNGGFSKAARQRAEAAQLSAPLANTPFQPTIDPAKAQARETRRAYADAPDPTRMTD